VAHRPLADAEALDLALPSVRARRQFGQAIGSFELMQGKLADMYSRARGPLPLNHPRRRAPDGCDGRRLIGKRVTRFDAAEIQYRPYLRPEGVKLSVGPLRVFAYVRDEEC